MDFYELLLISSLTAELASEITSFADFVVQGVHKSAVISLHGAYYLLSRGSTNCT